MKLILKIIPIALLLPMVPLALLMLTHCSYPNWYFDDIKVEASFNQDGSCSFEVEGEPLSDENYVQELKLMSDFCTGCTPEGMDGYFLTCEAKKEVWDHQLPSLYLAFINRSGTSLTQGVYEITESDNSYDHVGTHVDILKPPAYTMTSLGNGPNGAILTSVRGQFMLDEIQFNKSGKKFTSIITGHLRTVTQRRAAGW